MMHANACCTCNLMYKVIMFPPCRVVSLYHPFRSPTAATWLGGAAILVVYMADWKLVLGKIPYVKGRFQNHN